jgi:hypothetical protein
MTRYDTSRTSPDFEPPPRGLGSGIWIGAVVVIALVILGVFVWGATGGSPNPTAEQQPAATTTGATPTGAR